MPEKPILIIQIQRMGDLIMTFSLCSRLLALEPNRPLWVLAEAEFFTDLAVLVPGVVFFKPDQIPVLRRVHYYKVINLSYRDIALDLAGTLHTDELIGSFRKNGIVRISGAWRIYRYSIVANNRYNRFHWADLESLGVIPQHLLSATSWIRPKRGQQGLIGLFIGASEESKRPNAGFWTRLAHLLLRQGMHPLILGGSKDRDLATAIVRSGQLPTSSNFTGHFGLAKLALMLRDLDLVVTPDTGPMHLTAGVGGRVLNLSMGPVNAWETAPAQPGHFVLRPVMSCAGCWTCSYPEARCRHFFRPETLAVLVRTLCEGKELPSRRPLGLRLNKTARDDRGLFVLNNMVWGKTFEETEPNNTALEIQQKNEQRQSQQMGESCQQQSNGQGLGSHRETLSALWQEWFLACLGGAPDRLDQAATDLQRTAPELVQPLKKNAVKLLSNLIPGLHKRSLPENFWCTLPPIIRPLSGYVHILLQNGDFSPDSLRQAVNMVEKFVQMKIFE